MNYLGRHGQTKQTPQREPIPGRSDQVKNTAGGYVWQADRWQRLRRFLILGSEGGSYYASERDLTLQGVTCIHECVSEDGMRTVNEIVAVSAGGRAPKNDPALYALAVCISVGDKPTRAAAAEALPAVARIGTHLYTFVGYCEGMRGWGRTLRWAVQNWYDRAPARLALQAVKYRQRGGWTHRDLLRLAHPKPGEDGDVNALLDWITHRGRHPDTAAIDVDSGGDLIAAFEAAQHPDCTAKQAAALVAEHGLPREALQPGHLNDPDVWRALLAAGMPLGAMIRNLPTMTRHGVLTGSNLALVQRALLNVDGLKRARIHPMALLIALHTYARGHGLSRDRTWAPLAAVTDVLDEAFYLSFGNVEGSGKRTVLAIDVSGSMAHGSVADSGLSPRMAAAALAMVALHSEPELGVIGISDKAYAVNISKRQRLDDVTRYLGSFPASRTDLSLPFQHAVRSGDGPEVFITLTDNETWAGRIHPAQALAAYRRGSGIEARSLGVAMVANKWTFNDPLDPLALDVVGFDTATPQIMADFAAGRL